MEPVVTSLVDEIRELYVTDSVPWVVGYSGGKDSTATLQLIWLALSELPKSRLKKPVHVISTDTLVENPVVAAWVTHSLKTMAEAADSQGLPITPHRLTPELHNSFWVNLIGRGYPAPRPMFRWCTERLKIEPSNTFIREVVRDNGETILVLGTRKAESSKRAATMAKHERHRVRDRLSPNASLPNSLVYTPIEDWTNDDVWLFLLEVENPWRWQNDHLLAMYQGATADGECPLVVDTNTPSCGDSRFGCWVCTLVDRDRSMHAMIQNDQEKIWMQPLLDLRDDLANRDDRKLRDFRRMNGSVQLFHGRAIHGPYIQDSRERWLRQLLAAQKAVRTSAPPNIAEVELITLEELQEIRRIWVVEKHEIEDILPALYEESTGVPYPGAPLADNSVFGAKEMTELKKACGDDRLHFELSRELLDIERKYRGMARRRGLFDALEGAVRIHYYQDESDATDRAQRRRDALDDAEQGKLEGHAR